jgi:hypothetical protein
LAYADDWAGVSTQDEADLQRAWAVWRPWLVAFGAKLGLNQPVAGRDGRISYEFLKTAVTGVVRYPDGATAPIRDPRLVGGEGRERRADVDRRLEEPEHCDLRRTVLEDREAAGAVRVSETAPIYTTATAAAAGRPGGPAGPARRSEADAARLGRAAARHGHRCGGSGGRGGGTRYWSGWISARENRGRQMEPCCASDVESWDIRFGRVGGRCCMSCMTLCRGARSEAYATCMCPTMKHV